MAQGAPATGGQTISAPAGYIDPAPPETTFRLRFDAAYDNNRPDRAEFFYGKCGCFGGKAPGPAKPETKVDYQDISGYVELAPTERFSGFVEVPQRFINPEQNPNAEGIGDMNAGLKYALLYDPSQVLTFQFRTYIPTGDAFKGLGTHHTSLEPAFLFFQRLSDQLVFQSELRDWIPVGSSDDFSGNVLRYGVSLGYDVYTGPNLRVTPVVECVGWTVLSGKQFVITAPRNTQDAAGDTIINGKFGVRVGFGDPDATGLFNHSDIYVGYGQAFTGDVWYKHIFRVEYRMLF
jgi:hypothetical protein